MLSADWCSNQLSRPGSPWQNPYIERFNSRARDELFAREIFDSILEAKVLYADWCHAYNVHRPHRALSYPPPAAFAKAYSQSQLLLILAHLTGSPHPHRPQTNGKVERYRRTFLEEWAYVRLYRSSADRARALARWLHTYNHHRAHTALGGHAPLSRVTNLPGQYS